MQIGFIDSICLPLYRVKCWIRAIVIEFLTFPIFIKGTFGIVPLGQTSLRDMLEQPRTMEETVWSRRYGFDVDRSPVHRKTRRTHCR
jgi:hypothetical protein